MDTFSLIGVLGCLCVVALFQLGAAKNDPRYFTVAGTAFLALIGAQWAF
ncbi:MAG: hypothetical protein AAF662_02720 [Pseudomonadota bacterium]